MPVPFVDHFGDRLLQVGGNRRIDLFIACGVANPVRNNVAGIKRGTDPDLHFCRADPEAASSPHLVKPIDRHRQYRQVQFGCQYCGTLLEFVKLTVIGPLALGIDVKDPSVFEPDRTRFHRLHQLRVRVDRHDVQHPGDPAHETRLEKLARPDVECVLKVLERICRTKHERIEKALMVRTDDERPLHGSQIFEAFDLETHEDTAEKVEALVNGKREYQEKGPVLERLLQLRDVFIGGGDYGGPTQVGTACDRGWLVPTA
jgi:hypothetical protein